MAIEREAFRYPWTRWTFLEMAGDRNFSFVLKLGGMIVGYLVAHRTGEEVYISNLAVKGYHRGRGLGLKLVHELLSRSRERGMDLVTLDVRESNDGAITFYERLGFQKVAIRRGCYPNSGEDAYVMALRLKAKK
ncbi:ribosomal protein S18-alanine N-acetyltransferase [candidate division KSB1 bacterium]|nr:ribosomal protein S18-alanine N-acetyltransferase [candidate division KSB1 bacterium]